MSIHRVAQPPKRIGPRRIELGSGALLPTSNSVGGFHPPTRLVLPQSLSEVDLKHSKPTHSIGLPYLPTLGWLKLGSMGRHICHTCGIYASGMRRWRSDATTSAGDPTTVFAGVPVATGHQLLIRVRRLGVFQRCSALGRFTSESRCFCFHVSVSASGI